MGELTEKGLNSDGFSNEQKELLDLISGEVSELLTDKIKLTVEIDHIADDRKQLQDALETEIENANRIGSAAQMIGLHGLYEFCKCISENFELISSKDPSLLFSLKSKILSWPNIVHTYLSSPSNTDHIHVALNFLKQNELPLKISAKRINRIKAQFIKSNVEVDTNFERILEATPDLVSLELSEEVDKDLFDSFIHDLPRLTEELSDSVHKFQNDDFLRQLEISERIAHTIKGAGNTLSIRGISNLTHYLESIFSSLSKAKKKPSNKLYDAIQSATDCLEEMSEYLQGIGSFPDQSVQVFQELLNWTNESHPHELNEQINSIVSYDNKKKKISQDLKIEPKLQIPARLVDDLLKRAGGHIISNEQIQELAQQVKAVLRQLTISNKKVKFLAQELENKIELQSFSFQFNPLNKNEKFDPLEVDQFNELHTCTNQLLESADNSVEFSGQLEEKVLKLETLSANQVRNLYENQETVLRIRMIPVKTILPRLKRCVRQACKLSGKIAQLEVIGEETLIDSEYIHQLVDPITHILRNAVDHGIENSDMRVKHAKSLEGKLQLSFKKEGNLIRVACQDDGSGLDLGRIKTKSIEKGLLNKNEKLSKDRAIEVIQHHGFSTKDKVSKLSGRGVGLAVVLTKIHEMKGSVAIDSKQGKGLRVDIVIPTTFNAVHALIVRCADNTVAISNRGVNEILFSGAGKVISSQEQYYYQYQENTYPLYDLQFMLHKVEKNRPTQNNISLIINDDTNKKHAVMIDEIFDTRDIVTKPLSKYIPKINGLQGTTILADGSVTAVIDIVELLKNVKVPSKVSHHWKDSENKKAQDRYALIVEDAISTRKSLAQFMQDIGFSVNTAKDGVEAVQLIQKEAPSIVLTDLEMPRMNGLELTDHLRSNAETSTIPIMMITSKSTDKHKKEAKRLGVTAYITKPYDEDELLALINSFNLTP